MDNCAFIPFEFRNIGCPFLVWTFCIEISAQRVLCRDLRCRIHILFLLSPDHGVNIEFLHNTMNTIAAVAGTVETVDPVRHPAVPKNMVESIIIFLDQLGDGLVLFFSIRDIPCQPFVVRSPCYPKLFTHPVDAPVLFCVKMLYRQVF